MKAFLLSFFALLLVNLLTNCGGQELDCGEYIENSYKQYPDVEVQGLIVSYRVGHRDSTYFPFKGNETFQYKIMQHSDTDIVTYTGSGRIYSKEEADRVAGTGADCIQYNSAYVWTHTYKSSNSKYADISAKLIGHPVLGGARFHFSGMNFNCRSTFMHDPVYSGTFIDSMNIGGKMFYSVYRATGSTPVGSVETQDSLFYTVDDGVFYVKMTSGRKYLRVA